MMMWTLVGVEGVVSCRGQAGSEMKTPSLACVRDVESILGGAGMKRLSLTLSWSSGAGLKLFTPCRTSLVSVKGT
jgi:hypothetical protein